MIRFNAEDVIFKSETMDEEIFEESSRLIKEGHTLQSFGVYENNKYSFLLYVLKLKKQNERIYFLTSSKSATTFYMPVAINRAPKHTLEDHLKVVAKSLKKSEMLIQFNLMIDKHLSAIRGSQDISSDTGISSALERARKKIKEKSERKNHLRQILSEISEKQTHVTLSSMIKHVDAVVSFLQHTDTSTKDSDLELLRNGFYELLKLEYIRYSTIYRRNGKLALLLKIKKEQTHDLEYSNHGNKTFNLAFLHKLIPKNIYSKEVVIFIRWFLNSIEVFSDELTLYVFNILNDDSRLLRLALNSKITIALLDFINGVEWTSHNRLSSASVDLFSNIILLQNEHLTDIKQRHFSGLVTIACLYPWEKVKLAIVKCSKVFSTTDVISFVSSLYDRIDENNIDLCYDMLKELYSLSNCKGAFQRSIPQLVVTNNELIASTECFKDECFKFTVDDASDKEKKDASAVDYDDLISCVNKLVGLKVDQETHLSDTLRTRIVDIMQKQEVSEDNLNANSYLRLINLFKDFGSNDFFLSRLEQVSSTKLRYIQALVNTNHAMKKIKPGIKEQLLEALNFFTIKINGEFCYSFTESMTSNKETNLFHDLKFISLLVNCRMFSALTHVSNTILEFDWLQKMFVTKIKLLEKDSEILCVAVENGRAEVVFDLLRIGFDPNVQPSSRLGAVPLFHLLRDHITKPRKEVTLLILKQLLYAGGDPTIGNKQNVSPLMLALHCDLEIFSLIFHHVDTPLDEFTYQRPGRALPYNLMDIAWSTLNEKIIQFLYNEIGLRPFSGPGFYFKIDSNPKILTNKLILARKPKKEETNGMLYLQPMVSLPDPRIANFLIDKELASPLSRLFATLVAAPDEKGKNAIISDILDLLLKYKPFIINHLFCSDAPMLVFFRLMVTIIITADSDSNQNKLKDLCIRIDFSLINRLLSKTDIIVKFPDGKNLNLFYSNTQPGLTDLSNRLNYVLLSPLSLCAIMGDLVMGEFLLSISADMKERDSYNRNPFVYAIEENNAPFVRLLLSYAPTDLRGEHLKSDSYDKKQKSLAKKTLTLILKLPYDERCMLAIGLSQLSQNYRFFTSDILNFQLSLMSLAIENNNMEAFDLMLTTIEGHALKYKLFSFERVLCFHALYLLAIPVFHSKNLNPKLQGFIDRMITVLETDSVESSKPLAPPDIKRITSVF